MDSKSTAKLKTNDNVQWKFIGRDGQVKEIIDVPNLITTVGKAGIASRINGSGAEAVFDQIAIGTDATAANIADTTLGAEITTGGGSRATATVSRITTDTANDTAVLTLTYTFSAGFTVAETGVFNAASGGTLLARQVLGSAKTVISGEQLQITWKLDVD